MNIDEIIPRLNRTKAEAHKKLKISSSNALLKEVHRQLLDTGETEKLPSDYQNSLKSYVNSRGTNDCSNEIVEILAKRDFYLSDKEFSLEDFQGDDYFLILNLFRALVFTNCDFNVSNLPFKKEVRFDRCHFLEEITFDPTFFKQIAKRTIFDTCHFFKDVELTTYEQENDLRSKKLSFNATLFEKCSFYKRLSAKHLHFKAPMLFDEKHGSEQSCADSDISEEKDYFIQSLSIHDCVFDSEAGFYLNHYRVDDVSLLRTEFNGKFEFKTNIVKKFCIDDCKFEKVSDFFRSQFQIFKVHKTVFSKFSAFEDTQFGIKEQPLAAPAVFKYVTFKEFSNFRSAHFHDGLDIEKSNFAQPPNFLGAKVELRNSPRETFRIIKHSFDSVGNYIEANHFFSLEMKKMRQSVPICESTGLVFWINDLISGFGQSWFRPFVMLVLLSLINGYYFYSVSAYVDGAGVDQIRRACTGVLPWWDAAACSLMPFNSLLNPENEAISLGFGIIGSILIWQIVVAVKRLTRR